MLSFTVWSTFSDTSSSFLSTDSLSLTLDSGVTMAQIEVDVGEVVGGGEGEGGGAPHRADGQKFCQEGLAEVLINLGEDWEQEGWLDVVLAIDHPRRQG